MAMQAAAKQLTKPAGGRQEQPQLDERKEKLGRLRKRKESLKEELERALTEPSRSDESRILDVERKLENVQDAIRRLVLKKETAEARRQARKLALVEEKRKLEKRIENVEGTLKGLREEFVKKRVARDAAVEKEEEERLRKEVGECSQKISRLDGLHDLLQDELAAVNKRMETLARSHEEKDLIRSRGELVQALGLGEGLELRGAEHAVAIAGKALEEKEKEFGEAKGRGFVSKAKMLKGIVDERKKVVEKLGELAEAVREGNAARREKLSAEIEEALVAGKLGKVELTPGESLALLGARAVYREAGRHFGECRERLLEAREERRDEDVKARGRELKSLRERLGNAGELLETALGIELFEAERRMERSTAAMNAGGELGEMLERRLSFGKVRESVKRFKRNDLYLKEVAALEAALESGRNVRRAADACKTAFLRIRNEHFTRYKRLDKRIEALVQEAEEFEGLFEEFVRPKEKSERRLAREQEEREDRSRDDRRIFERMGKPLDSLGLAQAEGILKHATFRKLAGKGVVMLARLSDRAGRKVAVGYDAEEQLRVIVSEAGKLVIIFPDEVKAGTKEEWKSLIESVRAEFDEVVGRARAAHISVKFEELDRKCKEVKGRADSLFLELDAEEKGEMDESMRDHLARAFGKAQELVKRGIPTNEEWEEYGAFVQLRLRDVEAISRQLDRAEREFRKREGALAQKAAAACVSMEELGGLLGRAGEAGGAFTLSPSLRAVAAVDEGRPEFSDRVEHARSARESFAMALELIAVSDFDELHGKELDESLGAIDCELVRFRAAVKELGAAGINERFREGLAKASGIAVDISQHLLTRKRESESKANAQWEEIEKQFLIAKENVRRLGESAVPIPYTQMELKEIIGAASAAIEERDVERCSAALTRLDLTLAPSVTWKGTLEPEYLRMIVPARNVIREIGNLGIMHIPLGLAYLSALNRKAEEIVSRRLAGLRSELRRTEGRIENCETARKERKKDVERERELQERIAELEREIGEAQDAEKEVVGALERAKRALELGQTDFGQFTRRLEENRGEVLEFLYGTGEIPDFAKKESLSQIERMTLHARATDCVRETEKEMRGHEARLGDVRADAKRAFYEHERLVKKLGNITRDKKGELERMEKETSQLRPRIPRLKKWIEWFGLLQEQIGEADRHMRDPERTESVFSWYRQIENTLEMIEELLGTESLGKGEVARDALLDAKQILGELKRKTGVLGAQFVRAMKRASDADGRPMGIAKFYLEHTELRRPEFVELLLERYGKPDSLAAALRYLSSQEKDDTEKKRKSNDSAAIVSLIYVGDRKDILVDSLERLGDLPPEEVAAYLLSFFDKPVKLPPAVELYRHSVAEAVGRVIEDGRAFLNEAAKAGKSLEDFRDDPENEAIVKSPGQFALKLLGMYPLEQHSKLAGALNLLGEMETAMLVRGAVHLRELKAPVPGRDSGKGTDLEALLKEKSGTPAEIADCLSEKDPKLVSLLAALRFLGKTEVADSLARRLREREPPEKPAAPFAGLARDVA